MLWVGALSEKRHRREHLYASSDYQSAWGCRINAVILPPQALW